MQHPTFTAFDHAKTSLANVFFEAAATDTSQCRAVVGDQEAGTWSPVCRTRDSNDTGDSGSLASRREFGEPIQDPLGLLPVLHCRMMSLLPDAESMRRSPFVFHQATQLCRST